MLRPAEKQPGLEVNIKLLGSSWLLLAPAGSSLWQPIKLPYNWPVTSLPGLTRTRREICNDGFFLASLLATNKLETCLVRGL